MITDKQYQEAKKKVRDYENQKPPAPKAIINPDWKKVLNVLEFCVAEIEKKGYSKDHYTYIAEEVYKTIYGENFFEWYNIVYTG